MLSKKPWLEQQLDRILVNKEDIQHLADIQKGTYNPTSPWSPLKSVFLYYVADIYSGIIQSGIRKGYWKNMYYLDLFAGSGIGQIDGTKDLVLGSPLLLAAQIKKENKFTKMFLVEEKSDRANALEQRMRSIETGERFEVFRGDANKQIDKIIDEIKGQDYHSLIFIDPYGMEIDWQTMEKILQLRADIIFTFQTLGINRGETAFKRFFKRPDEAHKILETLEGDKKLEALLELYEEDIRNSRPKGENTIIETVRVKSGSAFYYDLIFVTKETKAGSPWMKGIRQGKQQVETNTGKVVNIALDKLKGRLKGLADFV